ncbi:Alpha/beta_hydrolase family protein [Hexamita inflata]|uniref:Alpha/beta hydrolase family protein n=1 Tax=Hexamita inflata TaxID=28002 RepID=A0AA86PQB6_9EUKA|nr:Alpha/beta hydrolase family protein [Hexamita inflata]
MNQSYLVYFVLCSISILLFTKCLLPREYKLSLRINSTFKLPVHFRSKSVRPPPIQYEQININDLKVFNRPGISPKVIIVPTTFGHQNSNFVLHLLSEIKNDAYIIPTCQVSNHSVIDPEQITKDISSLIQYLQLKDNEEKVVLIGISFSCAGVVKYQHQNKNSVLKMILMWPMFDKFQPLLWPYQLQLEMGERAQKWIADNQEHLIYNGYTKQEIEQLATRTTISKYDGIFAQKLQIGIEDYYERQTVDAKQIVTDTVIICSKGDEIAGRYVPKKEIKQNTHIQLIQINMGKHLDAPVYGGGDATCIIAQNVM